MNGTEAEAAVERASAEVVESHWRLPLLVVTIAVGGLVLMYFDTFRSMVEIWARSDTFTHGYFILPISLYLIWEGRAGVRKLTPDPDARVLVPMAFVGIGWLAARLGEALVAEQYFAVAAIALLVWAVLGPSVAWHLAFPLGYLLLAVPVGEALYPYLIDATTAFTVAALKFSGVPVLQQGNLLTLPNSQWSVIEECSGLRFLIACVTIGLPYAYLSYRRWTRRAAFIALSVAVPLVANWIRAYVVIMVGYLSSMRLAVRMDHAIYGWVIFAFVMCLLFWVGSLFRDPAALEGKAEEQQPEPSKPAPRPRRTVLVAGAALLCAAVWPVWDTYARSRLSGEVSEGRFEFPPQVGPWTYLDRPHDWQPYYVGASFKASAIYEAQDSWVGLHIAYYRHQQQAAELVSSSNRLVGPEERVWRQVARASATVALPDGTLEVEEGTLATTREDLVAWQWYWIDGRRTSSPVWAKILEAGGKLLLRETPSAGIVVFTEAVPDDEAARERLSEFLEASLPWIDTGLEAMSR